MPPVRAAFVFANPRRELAEEVAQGVAPDTGLLGENHLDELGIETFIHEPRVRRRQRLSGLRHRTTWNLRELTLPWELRDADVAVTPLANVFPLAARVRRRPRVVILNYGLVTTWRRASAPRRRLLRAALRSAEAVACLGAAQRRTVVDELGVAENRARVVEIGVDADFFAPAEDAPTGPIVAVGKDLARDYATLIAAAHDLGRPLRIVAEPRNLDGIELPETVQVSRRLGWAELRRLYASAACVVVPLRGPDFRYGTEASGLTALLEAMACAKPVVVTERSVLDAYAVDRETCLRVPPERPAALREALEHVLGDGELRRRLGTAARTAVDVRFTTRHLAGRLAVVLRGDGR
jgi:glycosyltransferase involved in cell wall biosynthesis